MGDVSPLQTRDPRRVGRYALAGRLGAGGMGVVFLAYDGTTPVAVKVIRDEFADDPHFRARFAREVDVLRRVGGLCTAQVLDADARAEAPYLVTEYVPGPSLSAHILEHGPLDEHLLRALAVGLAEALHAIHALGIVHRDLKPSNVLLSPSGPRVIDFGIAQVADATALTSSSASLGSPGYLAPEQIRGLSNTAAADVFTWGATLAYAASGRPPFGLGAMEAVLFRVLKQSADLEGWHSALVRPLVQRALDKNPLNRPAPAVLLAALLDANATVELPTSGATRVLIAETWKLPAAGIEPQLPAVPAAESRRRRRVVPFIAAAGVGAVLGLASLWAVPPSSPAQPVQPAVDVPLSPAVAVAVPSASTPVTPAPQPVAAFPTQAQLDAAGRATPCVGADAEQGKVQRPDLNGDGLPETLVRFDCPEVAERGNATPLVAWVFFAGTTGTPTETHRVLDGSRLEVEGNEIVGTTLRASGPDIARCCPDLVTTTRYAWTGSSLQALDSTTEPAVT